MRMPRIYCKQPLVEQSELILADDLAHRLNHVLRVKKNYCLILFNGDGKQYAAEVIACDRKTVTLFIKAVAPGGVQDSALRIHLFQGISKGDKMDWAIQKACELGVHSVTPLSSAYTQMKKNSSWLDSKLKHWEKIIIHASEQSGRLQLPQLKPAINVTALLHVLPETQRIYFLSPRGSTLPPQPPEPIDGIVNVIVGGEGGFSEAEETQFSEAGFTALKLGARILRTETAPVVCCSLFQHLWGICLFIRCTAPGIVLNPLILLE